MENYFWFVLFVFINGGLLLLLASNVSRLRLKHKVSIGDGKIIPLKLAIRAHANGAEQVPIFGLMILGLTFMQASQTALMCLVILFTVARLSHALGLLSQTPIFGMIGAGFTYLCQAAAVCLLFLSLI